MPMEPERLDDMERVAAAMAATNEGAWTDQTVLDLIAEIRRLTAERYAAVAQAQAAAEEARVLRGALRRAIHFMGNAGCRINEEIGEDGWAAYCAPPTAHAKLAAARADAARALKRLGPIPQCTTHEDNCRCAACEAHAAIVALVAAEREAGGG